MRRQTIFLILMFWSGTAVAEDVARFSGTTYQGCSSLGDTTVWLTDPNDYATNKPGFLYAPEGCAALLPSVPDRHRKVVGGAVLEMTQAEKTAVDAPIIAAQQRQDALATERTSNTFCTAELDEITQRIDTVIGTLQSQLDATTNQAQVKAHLRNDFYPAIGTAFKKMARCLKARTDQGVGQ